MAVNHYAGNRLELRDFGNDTRFDRGYDAIGRTIGTSHSLWDETSPGVWEQIAELDKRTYQWDGARNKTQRKDERAGGPGRMFTYAYDRLSRMTASDLAVTALPTVQHDYEGFKIIGCTIRL